ncbi:MAG: protein-tyrosine phosphatase [Solirubrobacteraceae bacterium]|nr:protein-tyrosine phosphatase [Solirubrobacteraceae bacterium]
MIDLHCHLLPGIDDGPPDLEASLALARAAAAAGTRTIVATPHIDNRWRVDPESVPAAVDRMRAALADAHIELEVRPGGEVDLTRMTDLTPQALDAVRLGGGGYILLESPHRDSRGSGFDTAVAQLRRRGERIVLAHPERCPGFQHRPDDLRRLVEIGVLCSITSSALLGRFGGTVRAFALKLLREGLVHNVASDAHEPRRRGPELLAGLHAADRELPGVLAQADWLTRAVPEAVLDGGALPQRPPLPARRDGVRRRLLRRDR